MTNVPVFNRSHQDGDDAADHFHDDEDEQDVMNRADAEIQTSSRWQRQKKIVMAASIVALVVLVIGVGTATLGSEWAAAQAPSKSVDDDNPHSHSHMAVDDFPHQGQNASTIRPSTMSLETQPPSRPPQLQNILTTPPSPVSLVTPMPSAEPTRSRPPPVRDVCFTDRFDNENMPKNNQLFPGQFICSQDSNGYRRYRFGMTLKNQRLVLQDMETNSTMKVYFQPQPQLSANNTYFFTLTVDGEFVVHSNEAEFAVVWTKKPHYNMSLYNQCLVDHDCPYVHLHSDGVIVLNWIDFDTSTGDWLAKNVNRVYGF